MAYSVEKKTNQMIAKLEKQLKPSAGRRISSAEQRRIKARIATLKKSATQFRRKAKEAEHTEKRKKAHSPGMATLEAKQEAERLGKISESRRSKPKAKKPSAKQGAPKSPSKLKRAHTPSATDKANAAKAAKRSSSRRKPNPDVPPLPQGKYSKLLKKVFG